MTSTTVAPDTAVLVALDFAPTLACEMVRCQAGHPIAEWAVRRQALCGCSTFRLCCEPCRQRILTLWRGSVEPGPWRCLRCRALLTDPARPTFDPIRGPRR